MDKIPLSVAVITMNEARNIDACVHSVSFADQIVVVDSSSTDGTPSMAGDLGCEVYSEPWQGFGLQKQRAIDRCRNTWVLLLDADERIPPETAQAIGKIVAEDNTGAAGYSFSRRNYFQGRWIKHLGWWPDRLVRLFRRDRARMSAAAVHEAVVVDGPVVPLDLSIDHYTEGDLSRVLAKIDHYSTLGARDAYNEGRKASIYGAFFRAGLSFVQNYFLKLGIMEGYQGLTLSVTDAVNKFFKYAKLAALLREDAVDRNS